MLKVTESSIETNDEIPAEVDFTGGVRGKYAKHFPKGSRAVVLDADVADVFPTSKAANEALRDLAGIIKRASKPTEKKSPATNQKKKAAPHAEVGK